MERRITRRAFLLGGGGTVLLAAGGLGLVDAGILPGRLRLRRALGACDVGGPLPDVEPGRIEYGTFRSAARGREVGYGIVLPPGARTVSGLPVCLFLHGLGGDHRDVARGAVGLPWFLADLARAGAAPMALVGVDGGTGYWHDRADGDRVGTMLTDELLPLLGRAGARTERIGLLGTSMGGYGALLWAQRFGPGRVAAAGAMSPALWRAYEASAPGAFDSADDFAAHDVFARRARLAGIPVRIDCGRDDPFAGATEDFLAGAPATVEGAVTDGCHDTGFWRSVSADHLTRISRALG